MARRPFLALMALTAALIAGPAPAAARSTTPDEGLWTTDGTVHALAREGRTVYVGGEFSWVGPHRGALARTDPASGERRPAPRFTGGAVAAIEDDGAGGAFVGGSFTHVDGVARRHLVHLRPDGSLDPDWSPAPDGRVQALLRDGPALYVGGTFDRLGGQARLSLGAVDVATGEATAFDPGAKRSGRAAVGALAMAGPTLYVAGSFLVIGEEVRNGLAALDTTQDSLNATEWNPSHDGAVSALHVRGTTLYLGGSFTRLGGSARSRIASVDTATGHVTPFDPAANGDVKAFATAGTTLYVAGDFGRIGGADRSGAAAFDLPGHALSAWAPAVARGAGGVARVLPAGGAVYLAGAFTRVDGAARRNLAAVDASTGAALPWRADVNAPAAALGRLGRDVLAGGAFLIQGGVPRANLAALDLDSGVATAFDPGAAGGAVRALAIEGTTLYAGGDFTAIDGVARSRIAALSADGTVAAWDPRADATVRALAVDGPAVYAGGDFTSIGGQPRARLAALDAAGAATAWDPGADAPVRALAVDAGLVYAGGEFASAGGQPRARLAALDAAGAATGWDPGADRPVSALAAGRAGVFAAGEFDRAGGRDRRTIAELAKGSGEATAWQGATDGDRIDALSLDGGTLYAGGAGLWALSTADGTPATWTPTANVGVRAVLAAGPAVLAGGTGDTGDTGPGMTGRHRFLAAYTSPPVASAAPAVAGAWAGGATLTCTPGAWANGPVSFAYTWLRDGSVEVGTGASYTLAAADLAGQIVCRVRAANGGGSATADSAPHADPAAPRATAPPALAGEVAVGRTVRCDPGGWSNGPLAFAYRWLRDGVEIPGAEGDAYVPAQAGDAGRSLSCRVTASNAAGYARATSAAVALPVAPASEAPPWLTGPRRLGEDVRCHTGSWSGDGLDYAYAWLRDGAAIAGETADVYRLRAGDGGTELTCRVTAANAGGSAWAVSTGLVLEPMPAATAPPLVALTGDAGTGRRAECAGDAWTVAVTRTYAWLRDGAPIAGAESAALDLTDADAGTALACRVTAATGFASVAATSAPVPVPLPPSPPDGPSPAPPAPPVPRAPDASPPRVRIPAAGWRIVAGRVRAPAVRCPASERRCRIRETLRVGGRRLGTARIVLAGGAVARPVIRVPARLRRTLRGRRVKAAVTLTVADAAGNRVIVRRTVVLRARAGRS